MYHIDHAKHIKTTNIPDGFSRHVAADSFISTNMCDWSRTITARANFALVLAYLFAYSLITIRY